MNVKCQPTFHSCMSSKFLLRMKDWLLRKFGLSNSVKKIVTSLQMCWFIWSLIYFFIWCNTNTHIINNEIHVDVCKFVKKHTLWEGDLRCQSLTKSKHLLGSELNKFMYFQIKFYFNLNHTRQIVGRQKMLSLSLFRKGV